MLDGGDGHAADGVGGHGGELSEGAVLEPQDTVGDLLEAFVVEGRSQNFFLHVVFSDEVTKRLCHGGVGLFDLNGHMLVWKSLKDFL